MRRAPSCACTETVLVEERLDPVEDDERREGQVAPLRLRPDDPVVGHSFVHVGVHALIVTRTRARTVSSRGVRALG